MDEDERRDAFMSALTTEHFVLQSAAGSTITEAAARSSLYMLSLSSSLIATGFAAQSRDILVLFVGAVFPAVFLLGVFTIVRLVDTTLENMQYLAGIARIRSYYRTLTPDAGTYFAARDGRWPEARAPSLHLGNLVAFLGTSASMIAFINGLVAGAWVALMVDEALGGDNLGTAVPCGVVVLVVVMAAFLAYQRWRFAGIDLAMDPPDARSG